MSQKSKGVWIAVTAVVLVAVLGCGALSLAGCAAATVVPGIAVGQWVGESAEYLVRDVVTMTDGLVQDIITSSGLYKLVVRRAQESASVTALLGRPISGGAVVGPRVRYTFDQNGQGNADLTIRLTGPEGTGQIHVVAEVAGETAPTWSVNRSFGVHFHLPGYDGSAWELKELEFRPDGSPLRIDLLRSGK